METGRHPSSADASTDENAMFLDVLHEAPLFGHRKPTSVVWSIFYCILLAGYAIVTAGTTVIFQSLQDVILPLLCSCHVILLIVSGIFQRYLVYQAQNIRLKGYYVFSQKLKHIIRLPFAIFSYGTAAMLLIIVWKPDMVIISVTTLVRIFMLLEVSFAGFFMITYIAHIQQYNVLDSQPDVLKSLYSPLQPDSSIDRPRYHDGGRLSDQQMALLQYQRENIHFLSEEILRLQECLSKYERSNDGSTPQVDLPHLLAAREQELRTTSAEINQLQSELTLTRSLIAERDSDIQRLRSTNNQYVEESERLRAILGEWSTRAAKLERALEAERMSNLELQKKLTMKSEQKLERALEAERMSNLELQKKLTMKSEQKLERALEAERMSNLELHPK